MYKHTQIQIDGYESFETDIKIERYYYLDRQTDITMGRQTRQDRQTDLIFCCCLEFVFQVFARMDSAKTINQ